MFDTLFNYFTYTIVYSFEYIQYNQLIVQPNLLFPDSIPLWMSFRKCKNPINSSETIAKYTKLQYLYSQYEHKIAF